LSPLPFKTRFWKRKLEAGRAPTLGISRTFARRVFYAGSFFYIAFLAHGWAIYETRGADAIQAPVVDNTPVARGLLEPALELVLGRRRGS
jgi:hypothetical protein